MRCAARSRCSAAMPEREHRCRGGRARIEIAHRHQSRRRDRRGRRPLRRRRQHRRADRSARRCPAGCCVSNTVHDQVRDRLPLVFEDLGEQQVKNIAPAGAGLPGPRRVPPPTRASAPPALPLPDKPSIAVLPFANMSGDPEQEYFVDGMVEEIITALSPHPLAVRHRPQFELHLQGPSGRCEAGRRASSACAMCSKARCAKPASGCASPAQLIDALTGAHLWADRFDGSLEDVFDLQDKVASSVAGRHRAGIAGRRRPPVRPAARPTI